jgi:hypothetical protein
MKIRLSTMFAVGLWACISLALCRWQYLAYGGFPTLQDMPLYLLNFFCVGAILILLSRRKMSPLTVLLLGALPFWGTNIVITALEHGGFIEGHDEAKLQILRMLAALAVLCLVVAIAIIVRFKAVDRNGRLMAACGLSGEFMVLITYIFVVHIWWWR